MNEMFMTCPSACHHFQLDWLHLCSPLLSGFLPSAPEEFLYLTSKSTLADPLCCRLATPCCRAQCSSCQSQLKHSRTLKNIFKSVFRLLLPRIYSIHLQYPPRLPRNCLRLSFRQESCWIPSSFVVPSKRKLSKKSRDAEKYPLDPASSALAAIQKFRLTFLSFYLIFTQV